MQPNTYSPVVLFVYNRPWHTMQTIEALQKNELAEKTELIIYSDAAKSHKDEIGVQQVRDYLLTITGFKTVSIIEREQNWGLADSIIDGVTSIVNRHEKVIVLEDDLVTSPYFLRFMNDALEFYKEQKKVWHISGWNYPITAPGDSDVFLWRVMNCWGWATWSDRWEYYEKDVDKVMSTFSSVDKKAFNLDGVEDFFGQIGANKSGQIDTWAIFWYASIFGKRGLCLNPVRTFVDNIGHDGSGVNCNVNKSYVDNLYDLRVYNVKVKNIEENSTYVAAIKRQLKKPLLERVLKRLLWK